MKNYLSIIIQKSRLLFRVMHFSWLQKISFASVNEILVKSLRRQS